MKMESYSIYVYSSNSVILIHECHWHKTVQQALYWPMVGAGREEGVHVCPFVSVLMIVVGLRVGNRSSNYPHAPRGIYILQSWLSNCYRG